MGVKKEDIEDFDIIFHEVKKLKEIFGQSPKLYKEEFDNRIDLMTAVLQSPENAREPIQKQVQFFFPLQLKER